MVYGTAQKMVMSNLQIIKKPKSIYDQFKIKSYGLPAFLKKVELIVIQDGYPVRYQEKLDAFSTNIDFENIKNFWGFTIVLRGDTFIIKYIQWDFQKNIQNNISAQQQVDT